MKKECVINQFFGLGDIMFIEPIYRHFHNQGYDVVAPINPEYLWMQEYIPYVQFKDKTVYPYSYETVEQAEDGRLHIPLRFAHPLLRGYDLHYGDDRKNWMGDKYLYLGLDKDLWRTMKFERNGARENKLMELLDVPQKYNFVNEYFGGSLERVEISPENNLPNIHLKKVEGYTLLDWLKVIEYAENIYTVETSILWPIEAMEMSAKEYHLFPRQPWLEDTKYIRDYLTKNWIYHDSTDI